MPQWAQGTDKVRELLNAGDLQKVQGADANGRPLLDKGLRTLHSAVLLCDEHADSSYTLAYDAARFACIALLAQQGLRPTSKGGHYAVEQAMRAQARSIIEAAGKLLPHLSFF